MIELKTSDGRAWPCESVSEEVYWVAGVPCRRVRLAPPVPMGSFVSSSPVEVYLRESAIVSQEVAEPRAGG